MLYAEFRIMPSKNSNMVFGSAIKLSRCFWRMCLLGIILGNYLANVKLAVRAMKGALGIGIRTGGTSTIDEMADDDTLGIVLGNVWQRQCGA